MLSRPNAAQLQFRCGPDLNHDHFKRRFTGIFQLMTLAVAAPVSAMGDTFTVTPEALKLIEGRARRSVRTRGIHASIDALI
jgi:hypothetical protein